MPDGEFNDAEAIRNEMVLIKNIVEERLDPATQTLTLHGEEIEKIKGGITAVQDAQRALQRDAAARAAEESAEIVVPSGPYTGMSPLDLKLMEGFAFSQRRESFGPAWMERTAEARRGLAEHVTPEMVASSGRGLVAQTDKFYTVDGRPTGQSRSFGRLPIEAYTQELMRKRAAMDSTTSGFGDELVPTLSGRELWMDVNLQTLVAPLIPRFPMPSNPFDIPRQLGDVNFYPGTENIAVTGTRLATGKTTLTAYELVAQVPYSFTLEEDSVIALLPEIRAGLVRNVAEVMDDIILNADTTGANGINSDGATITANTAGKGHWMLGYDGLIHLPIVDNTSQANDHNAAVSDDMFNEIRAKLGKYGARPSELVWVMDVNTFIRCQAISAFRTMDKLGPQATLLTGMLGAVEGIPVVVSEQMALADTDGKVTDAGNGTDTGRLLIVNRNQWAQGFRRELSIDVDRDTQKRQTVVTLSFRHALVERSGTRSSATHTALQYDITGV